MKLLIDNCFTVEINSKKELEKQVNSKYNLNDKLGLCFANTGEQVRGLDFSKGKCIHINYGNYNWVDVTLI